MNFREVKELKLVPIGEVKQGQAAGLTRRQVLEQGAVNIPFIMAAAFLTGGGVVGGAYGEAETGFGFGRKYTDTDIQNAKDLARQGYTLNADIATQIANAKQGLSTPEQVKAAVDAATNGLHPQSYTDDAVNIEKKKIEGPDFSPGHDKEPELETFTKESAAKRYGVEGTITANPKYWTISKDERGHAATFNADPKANGLRKTYVLKIDPLTVSDGFVDLVPGGTREARVITNSTDATFKAQGATFRAVKDNQLSPIVVEAWGNEIYRKMVLNEKGQTNKKDPNNQCEVDIMRIKHVETVNC